MIIRILGEGQYDVADEGVEGLQELDALVQAAVDGNDEAGFRAHFDALLGAVRASGTELPDDYLGPSDLVLPSPDSSLEEVRALLGQEGLIPG